MWANFQIQTYYLQQSIRQHHQVAFYPSDSGKLISTLKYCITDGTQLNKKDANNIHRCEIL